MNPHQLEKLGLPRIFHREAMIGIQSAHKAKIFTGKQSVKNYILNIINDPEGAVQDIHFGKLASIIIEDKNYVAPEPCKYKVWGDIDENTKQQMDKACEIPVICNAALMPDNHYGFSIPIGGVVACENAILPFGVGVDIACRMKLSIFDLNPNLLNGKNNLFIDAIEKNTRFGTGQEYQNQFQHDVMDKDWNITKITRQMKDRAWKQLGTSGGGNHFCLLGIITINSNELNIPNGEYITLITHSGSRAAGASVCNTYHAISKMQLKPQHKQYNYLPWLSMDSEEGQEYWLAMNLMGDYASANHDVIHKNISKYLGAKVIAGVENHHNFAWKENHFGKEMYVHRKGATPAGLGVLGIIPGSMGTPSYVVRGKGNAESLNSASHGAGRAMSRTKAKEKYSWNAVKNDLLKKGINVLSAGADEVPYAYKDIELVMEQQKDLVDIIARFDPKIVKMSDDGHSED